LAGKKVQSIPIRCPLLKGRIDIARARAVVMAPNRLGTGLGDGGEVITRPRDPWAIIATRDHPRKDPCENSGRAHCTLK
jgi:hypothetical protein